jgi:GNAT superfamily N-acetyltransferase
MAQGTREPPVAAPETAAAADLLVPLYARWGEGNGPPPEPAPGLTVRRALAYERQPLLEWVTAAFGAGWAGEVAVALGARPATCFVALRGEALAGFCCYDTTYRGFCGPLGVGETDRGRGIGRALLGAALHSMWHAGYAYAVIGASGATGFYEKVAGARVIPGSSPGPYPPRLRGRRG